MKTSSAFNSRSELFVWIKVLLKRSMQLGTCRDVLGNLVLFLTLSLPTTPRYCVFCIGCCCYHRWCVRVEKSKLPLCLRQRETRACFVPSQLQCILLLLLLWFQHGALCCCLLRPFRERKLKKKSTKNIHKKTFIFLSLLL